jgi:SAM-dependent methyltransferase
MPESPQELQRIYHRRFERTAEYRNRVWKVLTSRFFSRWIAGDAVVLDLGCGYGEFINNVHAGKKYAMDLNPDTARHLASGVEFLHQDCSEPWALPSGSLHVVFTSNFFEHLPGKASLKRTLESAFQCLKPGGRIIALGPNIKYISGRYWDFLDHHTILTEQSLAEVLEITGFRLETVVARFLPYTLVNAPEYPMLFVRIYLALPWLWWVKGRQFLVVAHKPS